MSLLGIFHRTRSIPKAPATVVDTFQYDLKAGELQIQANTLDAYYQALDSKERAADLLDMARAAVELKAKDGSDGDFDTRPGHVVLPDQKFEFHADSQTFVQHVERPGVTGRMYSAAEINGGLSQVKIEGVGEHPEVANWDLNGHTLIYRNTYPATDPGDYPAEELEEKLLAKGDFSASKEGAVARPGAQNLAEAAEAVPQRENSKRAQDLIQAALFWQEKGAKLDQKASDISPLEKVTVAPGLTRKVFDGGRENVLSQASSSGPGDQSLMVFDFESQPGGFDVHGGSRASHAPFHFSGVQNGPLMTLTLENRHFNLEENVVWNTDTGNVHYEKWSKQEPEDNNFA